MSHITQEQASDLAKSIGIEFSTDDILEDSQHESVYKLCNAAIKHYIDSAALAQPEPVGAAEIIEALCARIKAADDAAADRDYMLDSDDCIAVIRGTWEAPMMNDKPDKPLAAAKGSQPEPVEPSDTEFFIGVCEGLDELKRRDAAFESVRKKLAKLPRYSFHIHNGNVRRVEETSGNWIEFDMAHRLFDPVAVDAAAKGGAL